MTEFSLENPTKMMEVESFLANNAYLSGEPLPGPKDAKILSQLSEAPDRAKYPNLFCYWWNLSFFSEEARALWGKQKKDKKKKDCKKNECKKKEEKKVEEDEDDLDLFGEETEEEKQALAKKKKEKKHKAKLAAQRSRVVLDIKGFEQDQDFLDLGNRILKNVAKEGLTWEQKPQVLPIAFGMKKLCLAMIIFDQKVSADDIIEQINLKYKKEIQSIDIADFQKY